MPSHMSVFENDVDEGVGTCAGVHIRNKLYICCVGFGYVIQVSVLSVQNVH